MILLYLRKLYWYAQIKKKDRLVRARLHSANFPANLYGTVHTQRHSIDSNSYPWDAMSYASAGQSTTTSSIRGSISSVKSGPTVRAAGKSKRSHYPANSQIVEPEMDDGTASCASAASSVQVQGTDLYPMEMYDGASQFQPSSLYGNNIYPNED